MARNEEKALTLFSRWQTFKKEFHADAQNRKPLVSKECQSLPEAEKHRRDAMRQVTSKLAAIQNASLGEHRIRELNDEINKFMRQKNYWEKRIRELGGGDYHNMKRQISDVDGLELPGAPNYKYYGAAKTLPGVRELFAELEEAAEKKRIQRSRGEMKHAINSAYYGFQCEDDDDPILLRKEQERESELIQQSVEEHKRKKMKLVEHMRRGDSGALSTAEGGREEVTDSSQELNQYILAEKESLEFDIASSSVGVSLPTQEEVMKLVLAEKKKHLLEQFAF